MRATGGSKDGFTIGHLFEALDGRTFTGEREFQSAVIEAFNSHLSEFPPHYTYRDAITWAIRHRWIVVDGVRIAVSLPGRAEAPPPPLALAA